MSQPSSQAQIHLKSNKALPNRTTAGQAVEARGGDYGDTFVSYAAPTRHGLAEEGSYFLAVSPTTGTGQTQVAAQTAFSDTAPNFYIFNPADSSNNAKTIWLDFIKLITTAAATAATAIHYAIIVDAVARAFGTDNTQALTLFCPNGGASMLLSPTVKWQNSATASVIAASSAAKRQAARGVLGGLNIVGDEFFIAFGSTDVGAQSATTAVEGAGQPGRRVSCDAAIGIPPGGSATGHIWMPGSSASFNPEVVIGMFAR